MSRVESNDEQRIREMQEAQRRAEVRNREADRAQRGERSFRESMTARTARDEGARQSEDAEHRQRTAGQARRVLDRVRKEQPTRPHELAKRAALARAFAGRQSLARRAQESDGEARVLVDRASEHESARALEHDHLDEMGRTEDRAELEAREERLDELRRDAEAQAMADDLARERRRRDRDRREDDDRRREPAEGVAPAKARGAAPRVSLPPEILKRIVQTLVRVTEDGRTSLRVRLQGPGLEGVELQVENREGSITCAFSGCSDRLRRDLERARPTLEGALSRRGLRLSKLELG